MYGIIVIITSLRQVITLNIEHYICTSLVLQGEVQLPHNSNCNF